MRGFRFYADYDNPAHKRRDTVAHRSTLATTPAPPGNVLAVLLNGGRAPLFVPGDSSGPTFECLASATSFPNSGVATAGASEAYLRRQCRRISEREARRIHPRLFEVLDRED